MSDESLALYMTVLLVMVGGSFFIRSRGRGSEIWRAVQLWTVIIGALVLGAAFWPDIQPRVYGMFDPSRAQQIGNRIVLRKSDDEHFYARLVINGVFVRAAVDTGATDLVLTKADAARIGFSESKLRYTGIASTANGLTRSAEVMLDVVALGDHRFKNVRATVNGGDLDVSLLGMRFLQRFGSVKITDQKLELTP